MRVETVRGAVILAKISRWPSSPLPPPRVRVSNGGITEARSFFEERLIFDSVNWNSSIVELNSDVFLGKWGIVGIFAGEKEIRRDASEFVRILILEKRLFGKNFGIVFKICDIRAFGEKWKFYFFFFNTLFLWFFVREFLITRSFYFYYFYSLRLENEKFHIFPCTIYAHMPFLRIW